MALTFEAMYGAETGGIEEAYSSTGSPAAVAVTGNTGSYAYSVGNGDVLSFYHTRGSSFGSYDCYLGFRIRRSSQTGTSNGVFSAPSWCSIDMGPTGTLYVRDASSVVRLTITTAIPADTWVYIALYCRRSASTTMSVFIDGTEYTTTTGNFSSGTSLYMSFTQASVDAAIRIDDIYTMRDTASGSSKADIHTDFEVFPLRFDSASTTSGALGSGTLADIDDVPFVDGTEAVISASSGSFDTLTDAATDGGPNGDTRFATAPVFLKMMCRAYRGGGGGTTHRIYLGDEGGVTYSVVNLTTSLATFEHDTAGFLPTTAEYGKLGFDVSGGQDFKMTDMLLMGGHVPSTTGPQTVLPSGITSAEAFGTAVLRYTQFITPTGISSAEALGTAIIRGLYTVSAAGNIGTAEAFGSATLTSLATIAPTGIASAEAIGSLNVISTQIVIPGGIATAEAFGSAVISSLYTIVGAGGIASEEAYGTPVVSATYTILGTGIASAEAVGSPVLVTLTVISGAGNIATAEALGAAVLRNVNYITGAGNIATAEGIGAAQINIPMWYIQASSILSAEAIGSHVVSNDGGTQTVIPVGIITREAFGTTVVVPGVAYIVGAGGIPAADAFGLPTALLEPYIISGTGIVSAEAFGTQQLNMFIPIGPNGIPSEEAIGTNILLEFASIICTGIPSEEAFGIPIVEGGKRVWDAGDITTDVTRWVTKDIMNPLNERLS